MSEDSLLERVTAAAEERHLSHNPSRPIGAREEARGRSPVDVTTRMNLHLALRVV